MLNRRNLLKTSIVGGLGLFFKPKNVFSGDRQVKESTYKFGRYTVHEIPFYYKKEDIPSGKNMQFGLKSYMFKDAVDNINHIFFDKNGNRILVDCWYDRTREINYTPEEAVCPTQEWMNREISAALKSFFTFTNSIFHKSHCNRESYDNRQLLERAERLKQIEIDSTKTPMFFNAIHTPQNWQIRAMNQYDKRYNVDGKLLNDLYVHTFLREDIPAFGLHISFYKQEKALYHFPTILEDENEMMTTVLKTKLYNYDKEMWDKYNDMSLLELQKLVHDRCVKK